jgi:hypothetical protein
MADMVNTGSNVLRVIDLTDLAPGLVIKIIQCKNGQICATYGDYGLVGLVHTNGQLCSSSYGRRVATDEDNNNN